MNITQMYDFLKQYIDKKLTGMQTAITESSSIDNVNITAQSIDNVNTYAKTYLGALTGNPTTRNDGTALQDGDLFFDTTINKMKVYSSVNGWQLASSAVNGMLKEASFTGDGTTTTFAVTDGFDPNYGIVFLNGVNVTNDVDISDGQNIVFSTAPKYGDEIVGVFFGSFQVADTYTKSEVYNKTEIDNGNVVLNAIKNVDGAGSGLDADKLDGLDSSQFLRSDIGDAINGNFQISNGHNLFLKATSGSTDSGDIVFFDGDGNEITRIYQYGGEIFKRGGFKFWHGGNDGAGSGLDADKLDGKHASDLANVDLSNVTDSNILNKIKQVLRENVDGAGSGLDADKLDGKHASDLANVDLSNVTDSNILNKIKNVDGAGSGLDADLVQGVPRNLFGIGGDGYTWVDETDNRVSGATYTNTTGRPIMVAIHVVSSSRAQDHEFYIDGSSVIKQRGGDPIFVFCIIPNGSTYKLTITGGYTHDIWSEFK